MELSDRHVVITGAAGGIGSALARRFHAAGARLTISDLHGADTVAAELDGAVSVAADMSVEDGTVALIDAAEEAHGPVDLYCANAGVALGTDPMDVEDLWQFVFNVNFHAHRWAARRLLPGWLDRGAGYFCATASAAGLLSQIGSAPYATTKHAAVAFAEWLSITYGGRGLKVSCLCPQGVNTDMLNTPFGAGEGGAGDVVRDVGEVLEPADVADIVHQAIVDERFLILPHPEVAEYVRFKANDLDRWMGGMRKLQHRVLGV